MPFANERTQRKDRLLEQLDAEHELDLDGTFINHLVIAIRVSSPSERQQALASAR
jgi:hypothetical protein